LIILWKIVE